VDCVNFFEVVQYPVISFQVISFQVVSWSYNEQRCREAVAGQREEW